MLLILAGVSISLVVGNNGVLTQASSAVVKNEAAAALQEVQMGAADAQTAYYTAWAQNAQVHKAASYTQQIFTNNCPSATSVTLTNELAANADSGTVTVSYTAKSGTAYTFTIEVSTGAVTAN